MKSDGLMNIDKSTYVNKLVELGFCYLESNIDRAFLCFENALYHCDDDSIKADIQQAIDELTATGMVNVVGTVIVIVSYNGQYFMQKNIEAIRDTLPADSYQIIVVDNASTDGVTEYLEAQEDIILIKNNKNVGFAPACNQAVNLAYEIGLEGCDVFLLNNDTRLTTDSLFNLRMGLYRDQKTGAVGAISNYAGNEQQVDVEFELPAGYLEYGAENNLSWIMDESFDAESGYGVYEDRPRLSGFAMLIRAGLWQSVGGMDERFAPGYFEDDDLCMKISEQGYSMAVCRDAFIYHAGSQSFAKRDDIEQLLIDHHGLFMEKYGFDILKYAYADKALLDAIPYDREMPFNMLCMGCGLGADIKAIRTAFPNANIIGVEPREELYRIVSRSEVVFATLEQLGQAVNSPVFDVVYVSEDMYKRLSDTDIDVISSICVSGCKIIRFDQDYDFSKVKLVIWDMDNTFWNGVLSEGRIEADNAKVELIRKLTDAGIINSISSKNAEEDVKNILTQLNIWDLFVFNNINWENKGPQIKDKIDQMHLRAENVLFIDDEERNLEEARYYCPEIMTMNPGQLGSLLRYAMSLEISDPGHKRLDNYKLLEEKCRAEAASDSREDFLRESNIRVELCDDCYANRERIYELIGRTNQLNYTKVRDDEQTLDEYLLDESIQKAFVRVKDRFGDYGIAGFYCFEKPDAKGKDNSNKPRLRHMLFSCRIMGMGVPQYVYEQIGKPEIDVVDPVAEKLQKDESGNPIDWINTGDNIKPDSTAGRGSNKIRILMKGPCDMSAIEAYLSGGDITTEFNFVNDRGFITTGQNHLMNIWESAHSSEEEIADICKSAPFITPDDYRTTLFNTEYDIICLSLLPDGHTGLYKNKKTGHYTSFGSVNWDLTDPAYEAGYIDGSIVNHFYPFDSKTISDFRNEWEFVGTTPYEDIVRNLQYIYDNVPGNPTFVLLLGSEIEYEGKNDEFANHALRHAEINREVEKWALNKNRVRLINPTNYIKSQNDYEDCINHFARNVYYDIATDVVTIINEKVAIIKQHRNAEKRRVPMTILVYADNSAENAANCIESIRDFGGEYVSDVILVDNASTDGLSEWAQNQTDITYVYMDEGHQNYGKVLNEVISGLEIADDLLVLDANTLITPGMVDSIASALVVQTDYDILIPQYVYEDAEPPMDYETAVSAVLAKEKTGDIYKAIAGKGSGYAIRGSLVQNVRFDEELITVDNCITDFSISNLISGRNVGVTRDAYLYVRAGGEDRSRKAEDKLTLERKWHTHYFNTEGNINIVQAVQGLGISNPVVLEIGCDIGATLIDIQNQIPGAEIYGSELNENSVRIAKCNLNNAVVNNIEDYNLDFGMTKKFDIIIFGDVLEHLRNPLGAIEYCKTILNKGGYIVASIPNLMHISVMQQLINGNFPYQEEGLLDKTHIHFFTFNEIIKMFNEQAGYEIASIGSIPNFMTEEQSILMKSLLSLSNATQEWMYTTFQYLLVARLP